jgi:hypothetical protein
VVDIRGFSTKAHQPRIGHRSEHERYLTEKYAKKKPVIVMNYPRDIKVFYMRVNDDGRTVTPLPNPPRERRAVRGKSRSDEGRNIAPPISSWPALCRPSTPWDG